MQEISTRSPGLNAVTARPTCLDDADALVAENAARLAGRHVALEDVQVGAANGRLGDLDDRVRRRGNLRLRMVFEGLFARPSIDQGLHCHRAAATRRPSALSNIVVAVMISSLSELTLVHGPLVEIADRIWQPRKLLRISLIDARRPEQQDRSMRLTQTCTYFTPRRITVR